ncbi:hypothetical protein [Tropicimonas sp. IMCC34011]|uniref:hypothetical protein n=1 Tax=Tropicimonas sp. IMCC34011 TaxID=2248759 RepID=UPI000E259276|nr:hypothetical protein [Tropicimonas sp. IMCC34011]
MTVMMKKVKNLRRRMFGQEAKAPAKPEVLYQQPKPMVGLYALLSAEQKKSAVKFNECEAFGDPALSR